MPGDIDDRRRQIDGGSSRAHDDASMKENSRVRSNVYVQSLFDRKALSARAPLQQAVFALQEDVQFRIRCVIHDFDCVYDWN